MGRPTRQIGSDITRRLVSNEPLPETKEEWNRLSNEMALAFDWKAVTSQYVAAAQDLLRLNPAAPLIAYENREWYAQQVIILNDMVQRHTRAGSHEGALCAAFRMGEMLREAQLKRAWGKTAEAGEKHLEDRRRGGENSRKPGTGTDTQRLACYYGFRAMGLNKTDATEQSAQRLGVSPSTIRALRKRAGASD